jgi:hypothetical protein
MDGLAVSGSLLAISMPWENHIYRNSSPVLRERGYLIMAINDDHTDYVRCAHQLADSIRVWHPDADITIVQRDDLPRGDQGGQANDWQCYLASPYHETIKLEADMLITSPIDSWWALFRHRDMVISQGARDFYDQVTATRYYRKIFDVNNLPDVYNAITYWRRSELARDFFALVASLFQNWESVKSLLRYPEDIASTDLVYAIAAKVMGPELVTMPFASYPKITHMRRHVAGTSIAWWRELVWELHDGKLRIETVPQCGAFHYHDKEWQP